jgi:hypothetical protein
MRLGSVLVIAGTVAVAWQRYRRASGAPLPGDALRSVWLWYVGPLVPGIIVFRWGVETELVAGAPFARGWAANAVIVLVFLAVIALNLYGARKLQRRIEALEREAT